MRYTLNIRGEDRKHSDHEGFVRYERGGKRVVTEVMPISWRKVVFIALINAFAIQTGRVCWFQAFGKPEMFTCHARLEMELDTLSGNPVQPIDHYCH